VTGVAGGPARRRRAAGAWTVEGVGAVPPRVRAFSSGVQSSNQPSANLGGWVARLLGR
jgi:hypothetical protein